MPTALQEQLSRLDPNSGASQLLDRVSAERGAAGPAPVEQIAAFRDRDNADRSAESDREAAEQARLEAGHSRLATAATQGARGALNALLGSGALLGAASEGLGEAVGSDALKDFGRDLGQASNGKSAMEAAAFLFGGGGQAGLSTAERVQRDVEEQERAYPLLSTLSQVSGQAALALLGGEAAAASKGAALAAMSAVEGAGAGAQGAYEQGAPFRDVLTSVLLGGLVGAGASRGGEALAGALASRGAAKAATAEEQVMLRRALGSVDELAAPGAARQGGREAQGLVRELDAAREAVEKATREAGPNGAVMAGARAEAAEQAAADLTAKAGRYDPARVLEEAPTPLQKVVYRDQILDHASSGLSEAVGRASSLRPSLDFDLGEEAVRKLTKGIDGTDAIGGLQAALQSAAAEVPRTAAGDQVGQYLRKVGTVLDSSDVPRSMSEGHLMARQLLSVADNAPDAVTQEYARRTARAVMDELSGEQWGKAGALYRDLASQPSDAFRQMADPKVLRAALQSAEYKGAIGQAVSREADAVARAHDARLALSGSATAPAERRALAAEMAGLERRFSAAEDAVTVDGGRFSKVFEWAKDRAAEKAVSVAGGVVGGAIGGFPGHAVGTLVANAVRPAVQRVLPALLSAADVAATRYGGRSAQALARLAPLAARAAAPSAGQQREDYESRLAQAREAVAAPELPHVAAGVSRLALPPGAAPAVAVEYRQKVQRFLQDVPKPTPSVKGKQWETLSREQVKLANAMWEATTQPLSVFDDLARGDLDPDKASYAWKQYPGLQIACQASFQDELSNMSDEERASMPSSVLGQVDFLLGFGGQLDPMLDRGLSGRVDAAAADDAKASPQGGGGQLETGLADPTFTGRLAGGQS